MDFGIALSGLAASSSSIDTIGNNISNASTVGFKTAINEFSAQYLPAIGGGVAESGGAGVSVTQIAQLFSQGSITTTSNNMDVAIDGNGFLQLDNNGTIRYTRNGQLQVDSSGYLVSSNGLRVQGYPSDGNGGLLTGVIADIKIPTTQSPPTATSNITGILNLDSRSTVPTNASAFSPTDQASYNNESSVTIYDTLGNPHTLTNYFQLPALPSPGGPTTWNVYSYMDGQPVSSSSGVPTVAANSANTGITSNTGITTTAGTGATINDIFSLSTSDGTNWTGTDTTTKTSVTVTPTTNTDGSITLAITPSSGTGPSITIPAGTVPAAGDALVVSQPPATLTFNAAGALTGASPAITTPSRPDAIQLTVPEGNGSTTPMSVSFDFSGTTQFGSSFGVTSLGQNGVGPGSIAGFSFAADGKIIGSYTNGKQQPLGQVTLTSFVNPNGLARDGDNTWAATAASGVPNTPSAPGSNGTGALRGGALESSNVDLTKELVSLIVAQRNYQASAQTVKTVDQMLTTITSLR